MKSLKLLTISYIVLIFDLFLYSFTQIDLGLVISRFPLLYEIEKAFQQIGYFNRPLSTGIYIVLLMAMYLFYFVFLYYSAKKKISKKFVWKTIIISTIILAFSYNAFSYDLFNYMFDAKIVTHYQQNPYVQKALDYPQDPMLAFMHWTHRVYPYGPLWLGMTIPLSFAGLQIFLVTFFFFKALMAAAFLGSLYFVGKIFQKIAPDKELFGLIFFGFNPLLLIESVVSAHLDIVMMFFALWAVYLLLTKKYLWAWVLLFISIGIKFASGFLLPVFLLFTLLQKNKKLSLPVVFGISLVLLALTVIFASMRTTFQPWYLVVPLTFAVFLAHRYFVFIPTMILSFAALLTYVPYLYLGNWDKPVPQILSNLYISAGILSLIAVGVYYLYAEKKAFSLKARQSVQKSI
jgi:hypothetical protein